MKSFSTIRLYPGERLVFDIGTDPDNEKWVDWPDFLNYLIEQTADGITTKGILEHIPFMVLKNRSGEGIER